MAGEVFFEKGPHASRIGYRGEVTDADLKALRSAAPSYVSDDALFHLANKIMVAEADANRGDAYVPSRDQLAQLKKLKRIAKRTDDVIIDADGREHRFAALADALANLDQGTLELIQAAERGAIRTLVDRDGVFVDVDGDEHRFLPPTIQVVRPFNTKHALRHIQNDCNHPACRALRIQARTPNRPASVWLPRGIEGFIESVNEVITGLKILQDDAGRREKPWQDKLAQVVNAFWRDHCPNEPQAANRNSKSNKASPIVSFAKSVFDVAGFRPMLSESRLANLLHAQEALLDEPADLDWRDFANRK